MNSRRAQLALTLALALASAAADASCSTCGMCYNGDGRHQVKCIDDPAGCQGVGTAFYAPYACPSGIDCYQTNHQDARGCDAELDANCCAAPGTWGTQAAKLPSHSWVVLDHAPGSSFGLGITATATHVFSAGSMDQSIELKNAATGESVVSTHEGPDRDLFLAAVSLEGVPEAVYTYPSTADTSGKPTSYPRDLHASSDGKFVAMAGYFFGAIEFGDTTIANDKTDRDHADGFVAKINAEDGTPEWAFQRTATESTQLLGTNFDEDGNVAYCGSHKDLGELTMGVVGLLDATGSPLWEKNWGAGVRTLGEVSFGDDVLVAVGSMQGAVDFGGTVGEVETAKDASGAPVIEALALGLDPETGDVKWITRVSTEDGTSSSFGLVEVADGSVYASCGGGCAVVVEQDGDRIPKPASMGGAIIKLDATSGELAWSADVPSALGMAVAPGDGAVYAQIAGRDFTFGDTSFQSMGNADQYIVKIDKMSGSGLWALQQGGNGLEYLRRMCVDGNGDVYTTGMTGSDPIYFDPLSVDSHITPEDALRDLFVAKLATSTEALPDCKSDETTVKPGACFVSNACYDDGDAGRGDLSCLACDASTSVDELTDPGVGSCFVDGVCHAEGDPRTSPGGRGGPPTASECAVCDPEASKSGWSVKAGFVYDGSKPAGSDCTAATATDPPAAAPGGCTHCGACYNRDGRHAVECVKEYDSKCMAYYAPFACPPGANCYATNDETYGLPCVEELAGCYGANDSCDLATDPPVAATTPPAPSPGGGGCTHCGGCYNRDGQHSVECVKEYDPKCMAYYAPFACPPGADCYATNDAKYGQPCVEELENCYGPDDSCGLDVAPSSKPTATPPGPRPTAPKKGSKKKKKSSSDDNALAIGLGVAAAALVLLVVGIVCMRKSPRKSQPYREQYNVEHEMTGKEPIA